LTDIAQCREPGVNADQDFGLASPLLVKTTIEIVECLANFMGRGERLPRRPRDAIVQTKYGADVVMPHVADRAARIIDSTAGTFSIACEDKQDIMGKMSALQNAAIRELTQQNDNIAFKRSDFLLIHRLIQARERDD
jgi:hypothetical protein